MRLALILHPDSRCGAVDRLEVDVRSEAPRRLALRFHAIGEIERIVLPGASSPRPRRADDLWRHTCFEAFVRGGDGPAYHEFNLAPSRDWACYRFDDYRSGMAAECSIRPPRIEFRARSASLASLELSARLDLEQIAGLSTSEPWHLGLSAVIEERDGNKSYWALAHPSGAPDFHHRDCFALQLPAARAS